MPFEAIRVSNGYFVRLIVDSGDEGQYNVDFRSKRLLADAMRAYNHTRTDLYSKLQSTKIRLSLGIPKEHKIEEVQLFDNGEGFPLFTETVELWDRAVSGASNTIALLASVAYVAIEVCRMARHEWREIRSARAQYQWIIN
jgi:hypothetical protein